MLGVKGVWGVSTRFTRLELGAGLNALLRQVLYGLGLHRTGVAVLGGVVVGFRGRVVLGVLGVESTAVEPQL